MKLRNKFKDMTALTIVILILFGLPPAIRWYEKTYLPSRYPQGSRIINLNAMVTDKKCLWTLENINGLNYWWKRFKFADEIAVNEGETAIFRVKSADVLHSFAIPRFRIGPYEVEAGKVKEVEYKAEQAGQFKYLCWLWCSDCHGDLKGKIIVSPQE